MHLAPAEAMYVGDEPTVDVLGARRAGMRCILRAKSPAKRDARLAERVIERIGQLVEVLHIAPKQRRSAQAMVA